jgi:hypothetical protein
LLRRFATLAGVYEKAMDQRGRAPVNIQPGNPGGDIEDFKFPPAFASGPSTFRAPFRRIEP